MKEHVWTNAQGAPSTLVFRQHNSQQQLGRFLGRAGDLLYAKGYGYGRRYLNGAEGLRGKQVHTAKYFHWGIGARLGHPHIFPVGS